MGAEGLLKLHSRDHLFELQEARRFAFGSEVASVFDDMVSRSVPGYLDLQVLIGSIAKRFYAPGTAFVDLGCSTGTTIAYVYPQLAPLNPRIVGVDSSPAMLEKAREKFEHDGIADGIELCCSAIQDFSMPPSSLVTCSYTLQFIALEFRPTILRQIWKSLTAGGALVLAEKLQPVREDDAELLRVLYEDYKRMNGYSDLEIAKKREALKGVLIPASDEHYEEMLTEVGFTRVVRLMQNYQFVAWLCIKE